MAVRGANVMSDPTARPGARAWSRQSPPGSAATSRHERPARTLPVESMTASSQPHGTTAYAGSWDQGGESKRPAGRVPRIDHGVDRFFTAPQCRRGAPATPACGATGAKHGGEVSGV